MRFFTQMRKKTALFLAALMLCLALCSCVGYSGNMEGRVSQQPLAQLLHLTDEVPLQNIASVGAVSGSISPGEAAFHSFFAQDERLETLDVQELLAYESPYEDAASFYYKNLLQGDMLIPYMAMLYALDNGFQRAYFSSASLTVDDIYKAYSYLTCDSPFFESNYNISIEYLTPPEGDINTPVYYCMYTSALEDGHLEKKIEAYKKAGNIVASIPAETTDDAQKAEYLYRKVVESTRYITYENEDSIQPDYLYDALVLSRSNCDGFANALAMLYNLAGIESMLAIGSDAGEGHAWVTAKLGGSYYHFDPTYDSDSANDATYGGKLYYFRMSDAAAFALSRNYDNDISSFAPKCADAAYDEMPADLEVSDFSSTDNLVVIADALEDDMEQDDGCLVVACPSFFGVEWAALDASFDAMADEVDFMGAVDAYLLNDRGFLVLYGTFG